MVTLNQNEILIIGGYPPRNKKQTMFYNIKSKTFNKVVTICENLMLLFIESRDSTGLNFEWGVHMNLDEITPHTLQLYTG